MDRAWLVRHGRTAGFSEGEVAGWFKTELAVYMDCFGRTIRREALEEAARAIEDYDTSVCDTGWGPTPSDLAETVRALIDQAPK